MPTNDEIVYKHEIQVNTKKHRRCEIMLNRMQASCSLRTRPYIKKAPQVRHYYFWQLSHNLAPCGANIDHCIIRRFRYSTPTVMHISPLRGFTRFSIANPRQQRECSSLSLYLNSCLRHRFVSRLGHCKQACYCAHCFTNSCLRHRFVSRLGNFKQACYCAHCFTN